MSNKLLALNMIVAGGESELLDRCLQSANAKYNFDEIIIINTSADDKINIVAKKYNAKIKYFKWCTERYPYGNFGGARNAALKETTCKYFMWLDADDIMPKEWNDNIAELKKHIMSETFDFFLMPYNIVFDAEGNVKTKFERERIIKVRPDIFWQYPVHEQLTINPAIHKHAFLNGLCVDHHPVKPLQAGNIRNLKIIEHEYNTEKSNHFLYYYARELWNLGELDKSVEYFKEMVDKKLGIPDSLAVACIKIAAHNLYEDGEDKVQKFKTNTIGIAETYCRLSMSFSKNYAEPFVYLGDIFTLKNNAAKAIQFYKKALEIEYKGTGVKDIAFYTTIPAFRLAQLHIELKDYVNALAYIENILKFDKNSQFARSMRKLVIENLAKQEGLL